jgi:hypothetical protein
VSGDRCGCENGKSKESKDRFFHNRATIPAAFGDASWESRSRAGVKFSVLHVCGRW